MITLEQLKFYTSITTKRETQAQSLYDALNEHFKFDKIIIIKQVIT